MDSVPPARIRSIYPALTASTPCPTACKPDPHTRLIVSAGTSTGTPALSDACRATFMPAPACSTQPMITSPMSIALIAARLIASRMATAPRSTADRSLNTPPNEPMGVRQAERITALSIPSILVLRLQRSWHGPGSLAVLRHCCARAVLVLAARRRPGRYTHRPAHAGPFFVSSGIRTDVTAPAVTEIIKELKKLHDTGVTEDELTLGRDALARSRPANFETSAAAVSAISEIYLYDLGPRYYSELGATLATVNTESVLGAARRYFVPAQMITVVVGDRSVIEPELRKLNLDTIEYRDAQGKLLKK